MSRLPKALIPIYGTTLADTLGYTLMIPLLPAIVQQYGVSDVAVGALLSIPAFCSMVAAPVWGKLSDRMGRKGIIIAAQCLSLAGYVLLATTHSILWIFLSRIISGCGGGSLGAVESYIADVTSEQQRSQAFSLYGAVFGIAFVIGPATSAFLMHRGLETPFVIAACIEAINIVLTAILLPSSMRVLSHTSIRASLKAANLPDVRNILIRQLLATFAIICFLANLALFLERVLRSPLSAVGFLMAVAGVVGGAALLLIVSPLAARLGNRRVAQLGLACSFAAYGTLVVVSGLPLLWLIIVVWAVGSAMVVPTLAAALSLRAKEAERGAIMGLSDAVNNLAMILGPATGSVVIALNPRLLGVAPALAALGAFVLGNARTARRRTGA